VRIERDRGAALGANELRSDDGHPVFAGTFCVLMGFDLEFKGRQFNFDEFVRVTGWDRKRRFRNTCGSRHKSSDYHLHLIWRVAPPETVSVTMEFVIGNKAPEEGEKEPFAEDFIGWFAQFIAAKELQVNMYADFDYPSGPSRMLWFPLPMRAPVAPLAAEVEIDGISFKLLPAVKGIQKVWITQGESNINVHLHAEKVLEVGSIEPREQILEISRVLDSMFDRQTSGSEQ
jgi:hypothetical protein